MEPKTFFTRAGFLRTSATMLDSSLLLALAALAFLVGSLTQAIWGWLCLPVSILGWLTFETRSGQSLGKRETGLKLTFAGKNKSIPFLILLRNLVKWGEVFLLGKLSVWLVAPGVWFVSQLSVWLEKRIPMPVSNSWLGWLPTLFTQAILFSLFFLLIWIGIELWRHIFHTPKVLHDLISTSLVETIKTGPGFKRALVNVCGLSVLTGISAILMLIAAPVHMPSGGGAKLSSVRANMHTLQTMLETYAVDWGGVYPPNVTALKTEAIVKGREYWKDFNNPYTGVSGFGRSYIDVSLAHVLAAGIPSPSSSDAGLVIYDPVKSGDSVVKYFVYGLDKQGQLIRDKGQNLALTNS